MKPSWLLATSLTPQVSVSRVEMMELFPKKLILNSLHLSLFYGYDKMLGTGNLGKERFLQSGGILYLGGKGMVVAGA